MAKTSEQRTLGARLVFPAGALARLPTGMAADGLLKASVRGDDLILQLPYPLPEPPETGPSDLLQLIVDGQLVGDIVELQGYKPGDTINITLYAADRPLDPVTDRRLVGINYRVVYVSGAGQFEDGPRDQGFITDIVRPGRDSLGPLVFAPEVVAQGITAESLIDDGAGGSYLPCTVKGYDTSATGDWIVGSIGDTAQTATVEITSTQVGQDTELRFPRTILEPLDGDTHGFSCRITDRAGNESLASASVALRIHLSDNIDDLQPPIVPGARDGLVTDSDARTDGVTVDIPGHASIQAGDSVVMLWNAFASAPSLVEASDVGNDPLKTLLAPYSQVFDDWLAAAGDADVDVPATVSYRVERAGSPIGEPAQPAVARVNLFGAGGKDPAAETPGHENLVPVVVVAGGGGPPNTIPADAIDRDASATISGLTAGTPAVAAFRARDRIQLYWDGQAIGAPVMVDFPAADVVIPVPASVLSAHAPGTWDVHYTAARALATAPFVNTAISPLQRVEVKSSTDLPGGGLLLRATWVEGPADPGKPDQIDYTKALSGGGTPARIHGYANMAAGDVIIAVFQGYDSITPPEGNPVPESRYLHSYTVQANDLIPKEDRSVVPAALAVFVDIVIPTANLLPIVFGRGTFDYDVTNAAGSVSAIQSWIYVSVRPPEG